MECKITNFLKNDDHFGCGVIKQWKMLCPDSRLHPCLYSILNKSRIVIHCIYVQECIL
jgi:hypothetical protein|uniref:Uncharacterized protein n=1 Tax=Picea sitchensis TaxID=3332 RepID=D5ABQ1_PICSI|nr:unknown [Picea sitchensis]